MQHSTNFPAASDAVARATASGGAGVTPQQTAASLRGGPPPQPAGITQPSGQPPQGGALASLPDLSIGGEPLAPGSFTQGWGEDAPSDPQILEPGSFTKGWGDEKPSTVGANSALFAQGLSFGFSDEIMAGVEAVVAGASGGNFTETYKRARNENRKYISQSRDKLGFWGALIPELLGSLVTGGAGFGRAVAGKALALSTTVKSSAVGGAVYGAGIGEGSTGSQVASALTGAAFGALTPGAMRFGGNLLKGISRTGIARGLMKLTPLKTQYARNIADAEMSLAKIIRDGTNDPKAFDTAMQKFDALRAQGIPVNFADALGVSGVKALNAAAGNSIEVVKAAERQYGLGAAGRANRINTYVNGILRGNGPKSYEAAVLAIKKEGKDVVSPIYDRLRAMGGVTSPALAKLARNKYVKSSIVDAWNILDGKGKTINPLYRTIGGKKVINPDQSMAVWISAQKMIKEGVGTAFAKLSPGGVQSAAKSEVGRGFAGIARNLSNALKAADPTGDYALANLKAMTRIRKDEALDIGQTVVSRFVSKKGDRLKIAQKIEKLTGDERAYFRAGVVGGIKDMLENTGGSVVGPIKRLANNKSFRKTISQGFDKNELDDLLEMLGDEALLAKTAASFKGPTAGQLAEDVAKSTPTLGRQMIRWPAIGTMYYAIKAVTSGPAGMRPKVADELGKLLLATDGPELQRLTKRLARRAANGNLSAKMTIDVLGASITDFASLLTGIIAGASAAKGMKNITNSDALSGG